MRLVRCRHLSSCHTGAGWSAGRQTTPRALAARQTPSPHCPCRARGHELARGHLYRPYRPSRILPRVPYFEPTLPLAAPALTSEVLALLMWAGRPPARVGTWRRGTSKCTDTSDASCQARTRCSPSTSPVASCRPRLTLRGSRCRPSHCTACLLAACPPRLQKEQAWPMLPCPSDNRIACCALIASACLTGRQVKRTVLLNFRGNAHLNQPQVCAAAQLVGPSRRTSRPSKPHSSPACSQYSFGLRQQLYTLLNGRPDQCRCADPGHLKQTQTGKDCPTGGDIDGCLLVGGHSRNYIADLQRSVFCVVLPGNG